jgi:hypothetical protein
MNRWVAVALALTAGCECYPTNTLTPDAATDAYTPPPDAAFSVCRTEQGAYRCGTEQCPATICSSCYLFDPESPAQSLCFGTIGDADGIVACDLAESPCSDETLCALISSDSPQGGGCATREVCETLLARRDTALCHYLDGTRYQTGAIPPTSCPAGLRGLACGPGCGECDPGFRCFGPSEHSGVGHCGLADNSPDRVACGTVGDTTLNCEGMRRCLQFVAPSVEAPFGSCLDASSCQRLADAMPERFRCD